MGDFADNAIVILDPVTTNAADGGRESFSAALEEADITIYSDDGDGTFTAMTLDASTILITANPGAQVGVYLVAINMGNDADFTTGKDYIAVLYPSDETVDGQAVARGIGHWSCQNRPYLADAIWDEELTGATHNVTNSAGKILRQVQEGGFEGGSIWIDTSVGAGGEGTITDPADDITAALVIAAATGYRNIEYVTGSSDTLLAAVEGYCIRGFGYALALGGQSISKSRIHNATITGIATGALRPEFRKCCFGAVTLPPSLLRQCGIGDSAGQFTGGSAGDYVFKNCFSLVPGSGTPVFDFSGNGASSGINNRGWTGGANYTLDSDCTISHEVLAGGGTTITTGGADVEIRGITRSVDLVLSAAETVQFVGTTGPITLSGTTTATINLYGVSASLSDSTSAATVTDKTVSQDNVWIPQLIESYAADGVAPTPAQSLFLIQQALTDFLITGTTNALNSLDGTPSGVEMTLNDAAEPTASTRTA